MFLNKYSLIFLLLLIATLGCKEEFHSPSLNDGTPPGVVTNVSVINESGAARLTYTLPNDPDLLYVEAVYSIRPNSVRNTKSSFYNNNLRVDGFSSSGEYEVKLYAVDKGENRGAPVTVKINPGIPPVQKTFASLNVTAAFGGVNVKFLNEDSANIVITALIDTTGAFAELNKFYTNRKVGSYFIRGLPSKPITFGFFVNDRFDNISDTVKVTLTPIFEQQVPFGQLTVLQNISGDVFKFRSPWDWRFMFDGDLVHTGNRFFVTENNTGIPQQFTIDFQKSYSLSRFKLWQRRDGAYFSQGIREFELYGSMNPPSTSGQWDGQFIARFDNSFRPSGLPSSNVSSTDPDDIQYILDGVDYDFPPNMPPYRYIKFRTTKVWGPITMVVIGELIFYGKEG